jgi:hypothetical protein
VSDIISEGRGGITGKVGGSVRIPQVSPHPACISRFAAWRSCAPLDLAIEQMSPREPSIVVFEYGEVSSSELDLRACGRAPAEHKRTMRRREPSLPLPKFASQAI